ncbi:ROK family transcriptional regulator [Rathayibacter soli]|uniref:ROK family transcriptional regulator n=1 Tax=Rathayibacter soli TaxID=3144168 RepID=UPI0027E5AE81|nr:ROK family transcriptional regulator [Glaciibacter superstes]
MSRRRVTLANGTSRGLVLDLIRSRGPISRVELADATGLTQATMSTVVRQLIADGLVAVAGHGESTGGKPRVLLDINERSRFAVGVQLGSESVTYVVANLSGAIVGRIRTQGIGAATPEAMVRVVADTIDSTLTGLGIEKERVVGVGVVAPGPLDLDRGAILGPPHLNTWNSVPLRSRLAEAIGLPVVLDNDATAAALGEFWRGTLEGAKAHATVYMGTGIGAGILIEGAVYRGASSNAGELGQFPITTVSADGTPEAAGKRLVLEDVAGPSAVVAIVQAAPGGSDALGLTGVDDFTDFTAIATASVRGNALALDAIGRSAQFLATATIALANVFDLDSISLAGPAFAIAGPLYLSVLDTRLQSEFFVRRNHGLRIRLAVNVTDAAAVGGAALVLQSELAPRSMGLTAGTQSERD